MNSTPTATVPNKYLNDLTAGACYGQLDFTEQPLAVAVPVHPRPGRRAA